MVLYEPKYVNSIYVIETDFMLLSDAHTNDKGETTYRKCEHFKETYEDAFFNYERAAHAAERIIIEFGNKYGIEWDDGDLEKWDWFFIGFHHGCRIKQKHDPKLEALYEQIGFDHMHRVLVIKIKELRIA